MIHDVQKTYTPSTMPMKPLRNLRSCVINFCTFPHVPGTCFHLEEGMAGLQAATILALQLHRAWKHWETFPALQVCKVISSDWEPANEEFREECPNLCA